MRHPQIVIHETDGWLASQLAETARDHGWIIRESRRPDACLQFLREARPAILLLKLERKLTDELALLATVNELVPDCPAVVFSDVKLDGAHQRTNLAGLAYDLGARHVMFPPLTRNVIDDIVVGLMSATILRSHLPKVESHA